MPSGISEKAEKQVYSYQESYLMHSYSAEKALNALNSGVHDYFGFIEKSGDKPKDFNTRNKNNLIQMATVSPRKRIFLLILKNNIGEIENCTSSC